MQRIAIIIVVMALMFTVSCGGGSGSGSNGGEPAVPTTTDTKVVAGASVSQVTATTFAAVNNSLINLLAQAAQSVPKEKNVSKADTFSENVNYAYQCALGGIALATGTLDLSCTTTGGMTTCTVSDDTLQVDFQDCQVTETVNSVDYNVTLNDPVSTVVSGSGTGSEAGLSSLSFNGTLSGTATVTGDVEGTADLSNISYSGSGVPPTVVCSGTADVTTGDGTEVCTVNSTCDGCQA